MGVSDKCLLGKSGGYPPEYFGKFQYSEAILGVPNFWDGWTVTEILTCLKPSIMENRTCLMSGITNISQSLATQDESRGKV